MDNILGDIACIDSVIKINTGNGLNLLENTIDSIPV